MHIVVVVCQTQQLACQKCGRVVEKTKLNVYSVFQPPTGLTVTFQVDHSRGTAGDSLIAAEFQSRAFFPIPRGLARPSCYAILVIL